MEKNILASIIIPSYNQGRFIREAIDSVLSQDFPKEKIEIIVVDDGSTDNTREVVTGYPKNTDCRSPVVSITYVNKGHKGKAFAVKRGIELANGKYIFNLDSDDIFLPEKVRKTVDIFEKDKDIVHITHPVIYWNKDIKNVESIPNEIKGHKICGKDLLRYFYKINKFIGCGSTFAARTEIVKEIPINKKEINYTIDAYLILFCANSGYSFFMEEPLSLYRIHGNAYSLKGQEKRAEIDMFANEAILSEIEGKNFDKRVKVLQKLKTKISKLKYKELTNEKRISNILDVWLFILNNCDIICKDLLQIVKSYKVFQRSLPQFIFNLFRKSKT